MAQITAIEELFDQQGDTSATSCETLCVDVLNACSNEDSTLETEDGTRSWGLLKQFEQHIGAKVDVAFIDDMAAEIRTEAIAMKNSEDSKLPVVLLGLAMALEIRFNKSNDPDDLEEATVYYNCLLRTRSFNNNDEHATLLFRLGRTLALRFDHSADIAHIDRAIECHQKGRQLHLPNSQTSFSHSIGLFLVLAIRHRRLQNPEDAREAGRVIEELQANHPHEHGLQRLSSLGQGKLDILCHSETEVSLPELDQAILDRTEALKDAGQRGSIRLMLLSTLASAFLRRFKQSGQYKYILMSFLSSKCLSGRGISPRDEQFIQGLDKTKKDAERIAEETWDLAALEESIKSAQFTLDLLPPNCPDPLHSYQLSHLSTLLLLRSMRSGDISDLNDAVSYLKRAIELARLGSIIQLTDAIQGLAATLRERYCKTANTTDWDEFITCHRQVIELLPTGHPTRTSSLGILSIELFSCTHTPHEKSDYDEMERYSTELLAFMTPTDRKYPEVLLRLARILTNRSIASGNICAQDLQMAEQYLRKALDFYPEPHPFREMAVAAFASDISCRPQLLQEALKLQSHLDTITSVIPEMMSLQKTLQIQPARMLHVLASMAFHQVIISGDTDDMEEAIAGYLQTSAELPERDRKQGEIAHILGLLYYRKGELEKALVHFEKAANINIGFKGRFSSANLWAALAHHRSHNSALRAYTLSLSLLDRLITTSYTIESKHKHLSEDEVRYISTSAASCAISCSELETAVELLEQGRSILWSQVGRYRTPLDELETVHPDLANEFRRLSMLLEGVASVNTQLDKTAEEHRNLITQLERVVEEIHTRDGFSNFLKPTPFTILRTAAANGPVVLVNIDKYRSDAIIVRATLPPILVPLPGVDSKGVVRLMTDLNTARFNGEDDSKCKSRATVRVLRELWNTIVRPIVEVLQDDCNVPMGNRIWWCPTGHLWHLPLHAAGPYQPGKRNLPDIFVSSYTPTLAALLRSVNHRSGLSPRSPPTLLLVGQAQTPGQRPLSNVSKEMDQVKECMLSVICLDDQEATRHTVLNGLQQSSWVHLSCHGHQDLLQPFQSCFALHDGQLTLLDIIQTGLPTAELAFLSACHTAAGDLQAPNEAIHLAAGLQFAGFAGVVGTLWSMADIDGPDIARDFYQYMTRKTGDMLDYRDAAAALNHATKQMRKRKVPIDRWINFIHIGA